MSKLLGFLMAISAVLTLAPTAALALEECESICTCETSCYTSCRAGANITCGRWGECNTICYPPVNLTVSEPQDKEQQDDTSALVCSESQQDVERSASVKS